MNAPLQAQVSYSESPAPSDLSQPPTNVSASSSSPGGVFPASTSLPTDEGVFAPKPFTLTSSVREGYDSNTETTTNNPNHSFYTNFAAGATYQVGGPRFQMNSNLGGGVTYYYSRPGDKTDLNGNLGISAIYLATPKLRLRMIENTAYLSQPNYNIVGAPNHQSGDYLYSSTNLTGDYQWAPRLSTTTGYEFDAFYYIDPNLNAQQGNIAQTLSQSLNWLLNPRATVSVSYRAQPITYYQADLDSFNNFFLAGFNFIFNPQFTWSGDAGLQVNFLQNPTNGSSTYVGPYMDSNFNYQFGPASNLIWTMRYGTQQSGINDVTQSQSFTTGLALTQGITERLSGNVGFNYQNNYYNESGVITTFDENLIDISAGLGFTLNQFSSISAGYQFTIDAAPTSTGRSYTRNVIFLSLNLTY